MKYLIGIIPHDTIRSVLKGWGRHTSYQHVTENSGFSKYLIYADTVMTDCRFIQLAEAAGMYIVGTPPPTT